MTVSSERQYSMAFGNVGKWLRAQQHDRYTESTMSVHSCALWMLAMLGNGYELDNTESMMSVHYR